MSDSSKPIKAPMSKANIRLGTPYTETKWPNIPPSQQDALLRLLIEYVSAHYHNLSLVFSVTKYYPHTPLNFVNAIGDSRADDERLLAPIGHHRSDHVTPSKGKKGKKRKRKKAKEQPEDGNEAIKLDLEPAPPMITDHITVGLNSTTRRLEETLKAASTLSDKKDHEENSPKLRPLAAIFLTRPTNYLPYRHLPNVAVQISKTSPTLLVPLSATSEAKISAALGIPRVGAVGILEDAPGAAALISYVHENVSPVDVPWIREATAGKWLPTNILMEDGKDAVKKI